jgi:hypothetical protein
MGTGADQMMTKWIAALAALSLAATPAAAQVDRAAAPVEEAESLAGGLGVAWIAAALMVVAAIVILTNDDEGDFPVSP